MNVSMIVAIEKDTNLIGKDNLLPWRIPEDLKYFKEMTIGKTVVMGRKTYESIGKALPGRKNIVLSTNVNLSLPDAIVYNSVDKLLDDYKDEELIVIGGSQIYNLLYNFADKLYITIVRKEDETKFDGDTFFLDYTRDFSISSQGDELKSSSGVLYRFTTWERK